MPLVEKETASNKTVQENINESGVADRPELVDYDIVFDINLDGQGGIVFMVNDRKQKLSFSESPTRRKRRGFLK